LASVVWVGFDAHQRDWSGNRIGNKTWQWVVGAFFLWIIVFPLYLFQRGRAPLKSAFGADAFADGPSTFRRARWVVPVVVLVGAGALVAAGVAAWHEFRMNRANGLAVKYGAASSESEASLADRCIGVSREGYNTTDDPGRAGVPPRVYALLVPEVCALGVERGLVASDGTMSEQAGSDLTLAVIKRMGVERFQTLTYNELAVYQYHLASEEHVNRWHRCVAMGWAGYDAQPSKAGLPPREKVTRAVCTACTTALRRGLLPPSGAPQPAHSRATRFSGSSSKPSSHQPRPARGVPQPSAPSTFTGITEQRQQAPAWPISFCVRAAITPATAVP
jgi:hypothetical protein